MLVIQDGGGSGTVGGLTHSAFYCGSGGNVSRSPESASICRRGLQAPSAAVPVQDETRDETGIATMQLEIIEVRSDHIKRRLIQVMICMHLSTRHEDADY